MSRGRQFEKIWNSQIYGDFGFSMRTNVYFITTISYFVLFLKMEHLHLSDSLPHLYIIYPFYAISNCTARIYIYIYIINRPSSTTFWFQYNPSKSPGWKMSLPFFAASRELLRKGGRGRTGDKKKITELLKHKMMR